MNVRESPMNVDNVFSTNVVENHPMNTRLTPGSNVGQSPAQCMSRIIVMRINNEGRESPPMNASRITNECPQSPKNVENNNECRESPHVENHQCMSRINNEGRESPNDVENHLMNVDNQRMSRITKRMLKSPSK
ncbi:hypothetical protein AVEN_162359-1 [Araneus ventricosus]|uniref:Uncharacterized protein n=1 Tax=Araneus ventricosus TaxID=182803 RepID=A0A4Y2WKH7_ARAVE|nr:hypothetical protein AVEN_162359-1 [Araneus ventricosus]